MLVACSGNNKSGYGHFFRCLSFVKFFSDVIDQPVFFFGDLDNFCRERLIKENIPEISQSLDLLKLKLTDKHSLLIDSYDESFIKKFHKYSKNVNVFALNDSFYNSPYTKVGLDIDYIINVRAKAEIYDNFDCPNKLLGMKNFWGSKELWQMRKVLEPKNMMYERLNLAVCFGGGITSFSDFMISALEVFSTIPIIEKRFFYITECQYKSLKHSNPSVIEKYDMQPFESNVNNLLSKSDLLLNSGGLIKYEAALAGRLPICVGGTSLQNEDNKNFCALGLGLCFNDKRELYELSSESLESRIGLFFRVSEKIFDEANLVNARRFVYEGTRHNSYSKRNL